MSYSNVIRSVATLLGGLIAAQSMAATPDEIVCRDYPRPGSHMMMHVCVTPAEWNAMRARDAAFFQLTGWFAAGTIGNATTGNATNIPSVSTSFQRY